MSSVSVFRLDAELLDDVELLKGSAGSRMQKKPAPSASSANKGASGEASLKCNTCGVGHGSMPDFSSVEEARSHFKCDWHRHNIRRKLKARPSLKEEDFETIVEQENEISSISGSDSSDGDDDNLGSMQGTSGPMISFISQGKEFSMWQCALLADLKTARAADYISGLHRVAKMQKWAVILSRGGHFAAAIYECSASRKGQPPFTAKLHKTMHRYVVRAKAGGRQSTKDATGKYARSAGAQIRRHNEAALERDIQTTLTSWKGDLDSAEAIFYQLSSADRNTFFGGKQPLFTHGDNRLRKIAFTTRRPTFSEVNRISGVLLSISGFQTHVLNDIPQTPEPPSSTPHGQSVQPNVSNTCEDAPTVSSPQDEEFAEDSDLHKAARENQHDRVWDLLQSGHSPEVVDGRNRTPYQLATSKATRNAFRRYMAQEPDKWNYEYARVPSALTEEMKQSQNEKKAKKKARQRARKKEKKEDNQLPAETDMQVESDDEIERVAAEVARETERINQVRESRKRGTSRKVGGQSDPQQDVARRRELLAAAAEERLNALKQASQKSTLW